MDAGDSISSKLVRELFQENPKSERQTSVIAMKKSFRTCFSLILLALLANHSPAFADQTVVAVGQLPDRTGFYKPGSLSKADSSLAAIYSEFNAHVDKGKSSAFKPSSKFVQTSANSILVDIRAFSDGAALLEQLTQLGLTKGSRYGDVVSGMLPFSAMENALALPALRSITASPRPITHAGTITSQGDAALAVAAARAAYSVDGSGVGVGVISDGFDTLGGAAADIASGDLPAGGVTVLNGESTLCLIIFCIDEGRAMLQIVHDMAPGADLYFHSGLDGIASYANAISALAAAGADVIVDDLLIINEPMFQDGIVAQAVDSIVASGVAYFSAAGNSGRKSYEASFDDSGEVFCVEFFEPIGDCDPQFERVGTMHDFDPGPGVDNYMNITIPENAVMTIAMQWDQPFGGSGPVTDHDIVLLDGTGQTYITISANDNITMGESWEALQYNNSEFLGNGTEFSVILTYDDVDSVGPPATLVKLVVFGDDVILEEYSTNGSTTYGHANAASAQTVGAAFFLDTPAYGMSPPLLQSYSSAGGTPILFDTAGTLLGSPELRQKPEIVAVDGVNTTFFFDDSHGDDSVDDFFGTSAAAPHAAGVAALLLEASPGATPAQVNTALENTAIDMGVAGVDYDSGHGLIQADAAITEMLLLNPLPPAPITDVTSIADASGDGVPDLATLVSTVGLQPITPLWSGVDGTNFGALSYLNPDWEGAAIATIGDSNGDGTADDPAVSMLAVNRTSDKIRVETRSLATGVFLGSIQFLNENWRAIDVVIVDDLNGDGDSSDTAIAVLAERISDGRILLQLRDFATGTLISNTVYLNARWTPIAAAVANRVGSPPVIGVLAHNTDNNKRTMQSRVAGSGAFDQNIKFLGSTWNYLDMSVNHDANGDGTIDDPIWLVLATRPADDVIRVQSKFVADGAFNDNMVILNSNWEGVRLDAANDIDGNLAGELAIAASRRADGVRRIHVKDNSTGATTINISP